MYFRNEPVGCTATIVWRMYGEQNITPPKPIAGLLLSAILSDTLLFRSPTSTPLDEAAAKALAAIAEVDIPAYAEQMFEAGADLTGRTAEDVFFSDFKVFSRGDVKFGVGQSSYMTPRSRAAAEALVGPYLPEALGQAGVPMVFFMFTDMQRQAIILRDEQRRDGGIDGGAPVHLGGRGKGHGKGRIGARHAQSPLDRILGHRQRRDRRARDEPQLDGGPGGGIEPLRGHAVDEQQERIDHEEDKAEADIDR